MLTDPAGVRIRDAQVEDAATLVTLATLGSLEPDALDRADGDLEGCRAALAELAGRPDNRVLVAEVDGGVVGMCQLIMFRHVQRGGGLCGELESLHVHPDHRSSGIGGRLLEAVVEIAWDSGCYRVQLTSNIARVDAHRFYQRHGFAPTHVGYKRLPGG